MTTRLMFPCFCEFVELRPELPHARGDSASFQSPVSKKEMEFNCDGQVMSNFWLSIVLAVCSSFAWVKSGHVRFEFGKMVRCGHGGTGKAKYIGHFYIPRSHTRALSTHIHAKRRQPKIFLQKCRNIREFQTIFLPSNYKNIDFRTASFTSWHVRYSHDLLGCGLWPWRMVQNFFPYGLLFVPRSSHKSKLKICKAS